MSRDTYVVHNAYFDSGGPWGILGSTVAGYIEAVTGRSFSSYFNVLSGSSMGGVNAASLAIGAPAVELMHSTYACSIDLLNVSTQALVASQFVNQRLLFGHRLLRDHYDHDILYRTLKPVYGERTMGELPVSLLMTAHNMTEKRDEVLGCLNSDLFDTGALKMPLVNGTTPLIDAAMAGTSIPSVFRPYRIKGSDYRDNGMTISAGQLHKELDAALKARQVALHHVRKGMPLSRRDLLSFGLRHVPQGPVTLAGADQALVRTLFLGTGDTSALPYIAEAQQHGGFFSVIDNSQYNTLLAAKTGAWNQDLRDMARNYDPASVAATGMPAITSVNRSIIAMPGDDAKKFPSPSPLDASPANLHKVFYVAGLNVEANREILGQTLAEIANTKFMQGMIHQATHRKMCHEAETIALQDPWPVLERIIVTDRNGPDIYARYSKVGKHGPRRLQVA